MIEPRPVYIHASASVGPFATTAAAERRALTQDPQADLAPLAKRVLGQRLRQASHFIELATIGARLCLDKARPTSPADLAVYVGTGLGELRRNEALFYQVFPPGTGLAAPFDFINATANMAAFYVARLAGSGARNLTVTQGWSSFELALGLAFDDLRAGAIAAALVGGVDENCLDRKTYRRRCPLRDDEIMGEGSGWLLLSSDPQDAIAELYAVQNLRTPAAPSELAALINAVAAANAITEILCGAQVNAADKAALAQAFPRAQLASYVEYCGSYPTAAGFGVASRLEQTPAPGLWLHINRDPEDSVMLIGWRTPEN